MSTSSCEFVGVLHDHLRVSTIKYDMLRYATICYDIYTRLDRQRTNLARLSTISHDFYTTSDAFKNKKVYAFLTHGHFLIRPQERNKYDFTAMTVHFKRTPALFFLGCIHVLVLQTRQSFGALSWFLKRN